MATTQIYRKHLFSYGLLTLLFVLEHYESIENFEECHNIVTAIREIREEYNLRDFPTRRTDEFIKAVIESYKRLSLSGSNAENNSRYFAAQIIKENDTNSL